MEPLPLSQLTVDSNLSPGSGNISWNYWVLPEYILHLTILFQMVLLNVSTDSSTERLKHTLIQLSGLKLYQLYFSVSGLLLSNIPSIFTLVLVLYNNYEYQPYLYLTFKFLPIITIIIINNDRHVVSSVTMPITLKITQRTKTSSVGSFSLSISLYL